MPFVAGCGTAKQTIPRQEQFLSILSGIKAHFANDAASKKALHALPPHRFVIHNLDGGDIRYLYAEPQHCVCVFIGTTDAYQNYRAILIQPIQQPDDVSKDYKTQVSSYGGRSC